MFEFEEAGGVFGIYAEIPYKVLKNDFEKLPLVFDPGCATTLIDTTVIEMLGYTASKDMLKRSFFDGAVGGSEGYTIKLPYFNCFGYTINDFEVACHDLNSNLGISGLLGMNFLKLFTIEIDFTHAVVNKIIKNI